MCSASAGYVSMWVSARANIRVASAARRSYLEALILCFRGGAFSAVVVISMYSFVVAAQCAQAWPYAPTHTLRPTVPCRCVIGVTVLHTILYFMFVSETGGSGYVHAAEVPMLMVSCWCCC